MLVTVTAANINATPDLSVARVGPDEFFTVATIRCHEATIQIDYAVGADILVDRRVELVAVVQCVDIVRRALELICNMT